MTDKVSTIKIGGVEYDKSEVRKSETTTNDRTGKDGIWEQYKEYRVTLKDSTKLSYEEQDPKRAATVDILDDKSVNFSGLTSARIYGTYDSDIYRLIGCEFTQVDLENKPRFFDEKPDAVNAYNRKLPNGKIQYSKDNIGYGKHGDFINGIGLEDYSW